MNKVSFFIPNFNGGGAENSACELANEFVKNNINTEIITLKDTGPTKKILTSKVKIKSLKNNKIPIPNINWCNLNFKNNIKENFIELEDKSFYFIHSYMAVTKNIKNTIATAKYKNVNIPSIIKSKNIIGCQFHPEKSGQNGLNFLKKIIKLYE